ncbi:hypothetical protein AVEN_33220-1 [Araneus ventricosus]|uniref:Uncharacterized protein n=1 Tax=Araneus ventricosus TaxID=182803 RepID=A0A4Y2TJA8_ARAVE|nr:hypothetical protein AVEN_33220-1 [Araneus ventricosus]
MIKEGPRADTSIRVEECLALDRFKAVSHDHSTPRRLRGGIPTLPFFSPSQNVGRSFMSLSTQTTSPSAKGTATPYCTYFSPRRLQSPLERESLTVLPYLRCSHFSIYDPEVQMDFKRSWISKLPSTPPQFFIASIPNFSLFIAKSVIADIAMTTGFGAE